MSKSSQLSYRPCVGIMLLNREGLVFVGQRSDTAGDAWQMPQGGIDPGESPREAAMRELQEETGTDKVEIIAERDDWLNYDLPDHLVGKAWNGKYRGQTQKWFAMSFVGQDDDINIATAHPEFCAWKWSPVSDLVANIVPFKREIYAKIVEGFERLVWAQGRS
ncbi:MAG: RNA pyrophosphohydrolase [Rhodospirillales bacterium]|nr:RNA pyrophosphohydrolase [Rhodospirillales bacterium]